MELVKIQRLRLKVMLLRDAKHLPSRAVDKLDTVFLVEAGDKITSQIQILPLSFHFFIYGTKPLRLSIETRH
ncbi:hypothetical protein GCM10009104_23850 [Marinobacterium maritimum]|uniref:Uncharacterized protein n=1 Tax=Marinobacterium maritimum TaxID=500162 RepID=A0ABP3TEH0_9GAMM